MNGKHCVVIGGGLAGLAAAYRLAQGHWLVTLVEATERLGGRVKSHRFGMAPELVCELGGEWVGKNHTEMKGLCAEFGLPLVPHQYGNSFWNQGQPGKRYAPGVWCMSAEAKGIWQEFAKKFKKFGQLEMKKKMKKELRKKLKKEMKKMDDVDWWTFLKNLGFPREDLLRRDLMDSTDFGETIRMNSAYTAATEYLSTDDQEVDDTDEMDFKIEGGNELLVGALAGAIGLENMRMNWEVKEIRQTGKEVRIYGKGQESIKADACVFAAPAHWIRKITWSGDEGSPDKKIEASEKLQYARITKTAVLCSERFWHQQEEYGYSVCTDLASDFVFDSTYGQDGQMGILCSYSIGDKADDIASAPAHDLKNWIVEDVSNSNGCAWTREKIAQTAVDIERQAWQENVYTGGAYAFYRPGQWFTVRNALKTRFKRVFFAGEHIAEWQGFMEGAVETGQAAAKAVLKL
jgi:monoamine oxidase